MGSIVSVITGPPPPSRHARRVGASYTVTRTLPYLAAITGETAVAAGKTQTREGARYPRIARRRGKPKAGVALGNTQLKVYHALLSTPGTRYQDLDYYDNRASTRRQSAPCKSAPASWDTPWSRT